MAQNGRRVTGADLRGKVTILTFIFTRCTDSCPLQTARMATLQHDLAEESELRLVSVTVDPEYDTPAVLQAYGAHAGADPHRWVFLTGEPQAIWRFMGDALRLPFVAGRTATPTTIAHTGGLLLVDRDLGVRGYYGGQDSAELQSLRRDAIALLHKRQPSLATAMTVRKRARQRLAAGVAALLGSALLLAAGARASAEPRIIELTVRGEVLPPEQRLVRVTQGDDVTLRWTTDKALTVHLHGYNIERKLSPGGPNTMHFTARATVRFPIEVHGSGHDQATTLGYFEVYPR